MDVNLDALTPEKVKEMENSLMEKNKEGIRQSVLLAAQTDADRYAEATRIGKSVNVPPEFVESDLDRYRNDQKLDDATAGKIVSSYPDLQRYLNDPDNAKLMHDDIPAIVSVLDTGRSLFTKGLVGQFLGSGIKGMGETAQSASDVLRIERQKNPALTNSLMGLELTTALAGKVLPIFGGGLETAGEVLDTPKERRGINTDIASGAGQVLGGIGLAILSGGSSIPAMGMYFGQSAEGQTEGLDKAGVNDPYKRLAVQVAGGAVTAATEKVQLGLLMKGGGKLVDVLKGTKGMEKVMENLPKALQNKYAGITLGIGGAAIGEAAQETMDNFLQDAIAYAAYNPDVEFFKEWQKVAGVSGATGAIARSLVMAVAGVKHAGGAMTDDEEKKVSKENALKMAESIKATKLNGRSPEKMREIIKQGNPDGAMATLDATVLNQFFQSGVDPERFFEMVPDARTQFDNAELSGSDISIPYDEFVYAIANAPVPNAYDFMADFIKTDRDIDPELQGWDFKDPEQINAFIQKAVEQSRADFENKYQQDESPALVEQIERRMRDTLMNADVMGEKVRNAATAADEAKTLAEYLKTRLSKAGKGAEDTFLKRLSEENFMVTGPRLQVPKMVGTGDAYFDRLRDKVKQRKIFAEKGQKARAGKADLLGNVKEKRDTATLTPLINALSKRGKINRSSPIAKELSNMGIDGEKYPRLFTSKGGLKSLDNIPVDDIESDLGVSGIFSRDADLNGYASQQEILDKLRDETFGNYIRTDEQIAKDNQDDYDNQILDELDRQGIDIETATADEINAALDKARAEFSNADGVTYNQDGEVKTDTEAFKKWFGDSKVVDADGNPLVVYHGTPNANFDQFSYDVSPVSGSYHGKGFYFTTKPDEASQYSLEQDGSAVIPVYLSIKNPYEGSDFPLSDTERKFITDKIGDVDGIYNLTFSESQWLNKRLRDAGVDVADLRTKTLLAHGFDGQNVGDGEWVAFSPTQIKSVNNRGTFDANDPRILYQSAFHGSPHRFDKFFLDHTASETVEKLEDRLSNEYGIKLSLSSGKTVSINKIEVPKEKRRQGIAKNVIEQITSWADKNNKILTLSPTDEFGTPRRVLEKLYERNGFVANAGKNKDFSISDSMYRTPNTSYYQDNHAVTYNQSVNQSAEGLRSALVTAATDMKQAKGTGEQMLGILKNTAGVKEEEIAWTGLDEFLKDKKTVSKQEIVDYLGQNQVRIEEVTLGSYKVKDETKYKIVKTPYENTYELIDTSRGDIAIELFDTKEEADAALKEYDTGEITKNNTKFSQYTLSGGENYREVLLTLPESMDGRTFEQWLSDTGRDINDYPENEIPILRDQYRKESKRDSKNNFRSSHFDQPNILAHVRLNDRTDADGKKVLFVEEIQSDWHQAGRKKGYDKGPLKPEQIRVEWHDPSIPEGHNPKNYLGYWESYNKETGGFIGRHTGRMSEAEALNDAVEVTGLKTNKVPDAPFKKSWHEMAFRRIAQMAAQQGYDSVAWTTGEQQNDRFDLSKQVDKIEYYANEDKTVDVKVWDKNENVFFNEKNIDESRAEDVLGKDMARKIFSGEGEVVGEGKVISGNGLKVGGDGMKGFYDNILVKYANKFGKKYGAKVGEKKVSGGKTLVRILPDSVHSMDITDDMRMSAQKGFELFQKNRGQNDNYAVTKFFDDGKTLIGLFEGANRTSLMHEMGHLFLDLDAQIASHSDTPQAFKDEFKATLNWLGIDSYSKAETKHHEKFARGFEAYLYNGETPNPELKDVFQRMKLWFISIYKSIKELGVKIDPEMKGVFDRLLATDEAIEAQKSDKLFDMDKATLEMLNPKQRDEFIKQNEQAFERMKDKLFRKAYRQKLREKTDWWKEESEKVQAEVEDELSAMPVYQAIIRLQDGEDKLNKSMVIKAIDAGNTISPIGKFEIKYLPKGIMSDKGTIDPDIISDLYGFQSTSAMFQAIKEAGSYKIAVQKAVENRMIERHGDMLNDGTIDKEALDMAMQEVTKSSEVVLQALSEKTGVLYPSDGDFKKAARIAISQLKIDHAITPDKYYRAALKASKEYGNALGKKDFKVAADAKRREMLNKYLYTEAKNAREETNKALDMFKRLDKKPPKGNARAVKIDPTYHEKIWDLLDKYNFNPKMSESKRNNLLRKSQFIRMAQLQAWMDGEEQSSDASLMLPPELLKADGITHYRDMTLNEFRGLRDLIDNLETQGRRKREYIVEGQKKDLEDVTREMVETADKHTNPIDHPLSQDRSFLARVGSGLLGIDAVATKIQQICVKLDGGDNYGIWTRSVYEPIQRAVINKNIRMRTEGEKVKALMDKYYKGDRKSLKDVIVERGKQSISRENLISFALHFTATEDNRKKLVDFYEKKYGFNESFMREALGNMREKDWNFVMGVRDLYESYWPETSAIEKSRFGYAPEKLEALPDEEFITIEGNKITVRGGYARIMYDSRLSYRTTDNDLKDAFKELTIGKGSVVATKRGSMIERVSTTNQGIRLDFDVIGDHVAEQVGIITMSEAVENAAKVMRQNNVQKVLHENLGAEYKMVMDLWLQDIAVGEGTSAQINGNWMRKARTNYTVGKLALKPLTSILQLSGIVQTASDPDLGIKYTLKGLTKFMAQNPIETSRQIREKSKFMSERKFTLTRDAAEALNEYTRVGKTVGNKTSALMLLPMQKMQAVTDMVTWLGAYEFAIDKGMTEADAVRYSDLSVSRLQGSGLASDLAAIERGTVSSKVQRSEIVKAGTVMYSYFNAKYNIIKNAKYKYDNKQITGVDFASTIVLSILVEGFVSAFLMGQLDWDDEEDGLSIGDVTVGLGSLIFYQASGAVPYARTMASSMQGFTPQDALTAQISALGKLAGAVIKDTDDLITDEKNLEDINWESRLKRTVDAIGVFIAIPSSQIKVIIGALAKEDAELMDYLVYRE